jgi:N-sulfoglucosamine sulfohydrolase
MIRLVRRSPSPILVSPTFINSKTTLYDAGVPLPLIIRHPRIKRAVSQNLISYVDILPTVLDYAGHSGIVDQSKKRLGRCLIPLLGNDSTLPDWNQVFVSHTFHEVTNYWPTRFIRNRRYKYHRNLAWRLDFPFAADLYGSLSWEDIRNIDSTKGDTLIGGRKLRDYFFRPPEELYDLENDPNEIHNLVKDPEHAAILENLRGKLEEWQLRTEDPWLYRDGVSVWFVRNHLKAGLNLPDRFDFDAERPGNKNEAGFPNDVSWGAEVDWKHS